MGTASRRARCASCRTWALAPELASCHRFEGLRSHGFGRSLVMPWPVVKGLPPYGYVVTRKDLDGLVAGNAAKSGASLWEHTEAVEPIMEGPSLRGARIAAKGEDGHAGQVTARYVVVADGANSRFGWSLGNQRKREYPQGMALRGYWSSPRHDEPWIDSWLDLKDEAGNAMPGYGWIFPLGDGRINVGVGLLSTGNRWKGVNTTQMLEAFCSYAARVVGDQARDLPWPGHRGPAPDGLFGRPEVRPEPPGRGRCRRLDQPFQRRGHHLRLRDRPHGGRSPPRGAHELVTPRVLRLYEERLQAEYGLYYRVARAFVRAISRPQVMRACTATGMQSRSLMEWLLRIMSNLLRPDEMGPAEAAYKALAAIARAKTPSELKQAQRQG